MTIVAFRRRFLPFFGTYAFLYSYFAPELSLLRGPNPQYELESILNFRNAAREDFVIHTPVVQVLAK